MSRVLLNALVGRVSAQIGVQNERLLTNFSQTQNAQLDARRRRPDA